MLRAYRRIIAASAIALAPNAFASETAVALHGFAQSSCGAWAATASRPAERQVILYWFRGFVSGVNYADSAHQITLDRMPDNDTLSLYIDKYCRDNPLNGFEPAAFGLVKGLRGGR